MSERSGTSNNNFVYPAAIGSRKLQNKTTLTTGKSLRVTLISLCRGDVGTEKSQARGPL